jgi:hypothetical protein
LIEDVGERERGAQHTTTTTLSFVSVVMEENTEWHNKLKRAARSITIIIHNRTARVLRQIHSTVRQGTWVSPPPEQIQSGQRVEFCASNFDYSFFVECEYHSV